MAAAAGEALGKSASPFPSLGHQPSAQPPRGGSPQADPGCRRRRWAGPRDGLAEGGLEVSADGKAGRFHGRKVSRVYRRTTIAQEAERSWVWPPDAAIAAPGRLGRPS
jgi:hypothetical protein